MVETTLVSDCAIPSSRLTALWTPCALVNFSRFVNPYVPAGLAFSNRRKSSFEIMSRVKCSGERLFSSLTSFEQWRSVTFGWVVVSSWTKSRFGSEPNRWAPVACETGLSNALDMLPHRFYRLGQRVDNFFIPALDSRGRLGEV